MTDTAPLTYTVHRTFTVQPESMEHDFGANPKERRFWASAEVDWLLGRPAVKLTDLRLVVGDNVSGLNLTKLVPEDEPSLLGHLCATIQSDIHWLEKKHRVEFLKAGASLSAGYAHLPVRV